MRIRIGTASLLLVLVAAATFGQDGARYRVTIEAGEDDDDVISQLAARYRARLEPFREEGFHGFVATMSASSALLLSRHPRVLRVEEVPSSPAPRPLPERSREPATAAVSLKQEGNAGSGQWTTGLYQYDGSGNIKRIDTEAFIYDRFGRVKTGAAGAGKWQDYTYDRFGNLLTIATDGAAPIVLGVDENTNQVTQAANVTASYDEVGQLLSVSSGDSFQWDGLGMVTKSTVSGVPRVHLYTVNDERIATINRLTNVEEWTLRDVSGKVLRSFTREPAKWSWTEDYVYRDGQLLAAEVSGAHRRLQFHLDHLGTPRLITSDGGARVALHTYYPFGREATDPAQDGERRKFTGHERDAASLDYMHARYYNPAWGRFLSVDPGPSDLRRPQTWDRYAYAEDNPVKNVDPDGRLTNPVTGEQGKGRPILHRGGAFGQIRKEQPSVPGSAAGEFGAGRAGGRTHKGVDIIAPGGTPLVAAFSGKAYEIRENDKKLGLSVFVQGKDGVIAIYSHLSSTDVKEGDTVKEGQQVGEAGRSGNVMKAQPASEDHVHFQLYGENGKVTDPEAFLNDPKKQEKYRDPKDKQEKQQQ